jgi:hypothetical protein
MILNVLNTSAQQDIVLSNICGCLQLVACQVLWRWPTTLTGVGGFGSVMEVRRTRAVQGFKRAVTCDDTAEELATG